MGLSLLLGGLACAAVGFSVGFQVGQASGARIATRGLLTLLGLRIDLFSGRDLAGRQSDTGDVVH